MLAARYDRYGRPEVLGLCPEAMPVPKRGQLVVRVHAAALNPKDVIVQSGRLPLFRFLAGSRFPKHVGYDWSGEVVSCGPGVSGFATGDPLYGMMNGWAGGACATHAVVSVRELARKPSKLSWEKAAAVPLAAQTALQALRDVARVVRGARVLINGASGGVGTFAVQIAKALGARVTAVTSGANEDLVRSIGADEALDYQTCDIRASGERFDVFFDVFGNPSFGFAAPVLTETGTYVSTVPKPRLLRDIATTMVGRKRARLVRVRSRTSDLTTLAWWAERSILEPVVDSIYPLHEIAAAEARVASRRSRGKVVLTVTDDEVTSAPRRVR